MDAARDLFVEKGYQHVSMRQIAKELKYSHGAIYYHFQNKAELFYALVEEHFHLLELELDQYYESRIRFKRKIEANLFGLYEIWSKQSKPL